METRILGSEQGQEPDELVSSRPASPNSPYPFHCAEPFRAVRSRPSDLHCSLASTNNSSQPQVEGRRRSIGEMAAKGRRRLRRCRSISSKTLRFLGRNPSLALQSLNLVLLANKCQPPADQGRTFKSVSSSDATLEDRILKRYWKAKNELKRKYEELFANLKSEELAEVQHCIERRARTADRIRADYLLEDVSGIKEYYESTRTLLAGQRLVELEEILSALKISLARSQS